MLQAFANLNGGSFYSDYLGRNGYAPAFTFTADDSVMSIQVSGGVFTFNILRDNVSILKRIGSTVERRTCNIGESFVINYNQFIVFMAWLQSDDDDYRG